MGRNESRVGKLEAQTTWHHPVGYVRVIAEIGEPSNDCIRRHGYDPEDTARRYIVRAIVESDSSSITE